MAQDEFTMSPEEFRALRDQSAAIGQNDVQLGRMLDAIVLHLGHAHGLDPAQEDARVKAERDAAAKAAEEQAAPATGPVQEEGV